MEIFNIFNQLSSAKSHHVTLPIPSLGGSKRSGAAAVPRVLPRLRRSRRLEARPLPQQCAAAGATPGTAWLGGAWGRAPGGAWGGMGPWDAMAA